MSKFAFIVLIIIFCSCSQRENPPAKNEKKNFSSDNMLTGEWEWFAGIAGNSASSITLKDREANSIYFAESDYKSYILDRQVESGKYKISREKMGGRDSIMIVKFSTTDSLSGEFTEYEMLTTVRNDTLTLYPAACSDCLTDYYKRKR